MTSRFNYPTYYAVISRELPDNTIEHFCGFDELEAARGNITSEETIEWSTDINDAAKLKLSDIPALVSGQPDHYRSICGLTCYVSLYKDMDGSQVELRRL